MACYKWLTERILKFRANVENIKERDKLFFKIFYLAYVFIFLYAISFSLNRITQTADSVTVLFNAFFMIVDIIILFFSVYALRILLTYKITIQRVNDSLKRVKDYLKDKKIKKSINELYSNTMPLVSEYLRPKTSNYNEYSEIVLRLLNIYITSLIIPLIETKRNTTYAHIISFIDGLQNAISDKNPSEVYDKLKRFDEKIINDKNIKEDLLTYHRLNYNFFEMPLYKRIENIKPSKMLKLWGFFYKLTASPPWDKIVYMLVAIVLIIQFALTGKLTMP